MTLTFGGYLIVTAAIAGMISLFAAAHDRTTLALLSYAVLLVSVIAFFAWMWLTVTSLLLVTLP